MDQMADRLGQRYHEMSAKRLERISSSPPPDSTSYRDCGFDLACSIPAPSPYAVTLQMLRRHAIRSPADIPLKPY